MRSRMAVAGGCLVALAMAAQSRPAAQGRAVDPALFSDMQWRLIGPFRGGRTVGASGSAAAAQRLLRRRQQRRRLEDDRRRPHVDADLRRPADAVDRHDRRRAVRPQRHLRRQRRRAAAPRPRGRRRHLQVDRRRPDVDASRPARGAADRRHPDRSEGSVARVRGGARPSVRAERGARRLPLDRRRPHVAEGPLQGREHGRDRPRLRSRPTRRPIYAVLWAARQGPWEYNNAYSGPASGLFKSTDGGSTWRPLTRGLPTPAEGLGRIGIAVAPTDARRLYAWVTAPPGGSGIYRSDDAGESWTRTNSEPRVVGRGDDFACVRVDPKNPDIVYAANTSTYKSTDGGHSFTAIKGAPGGDDYHTIWINPENPDIMLFAVDQGATITVNGGRTWSSWYNQPTAQMFHVTADNRFPYWVYGGQQESGSAGVPSRGRDGADHLSRLASGRRRGVRLRRARSAAPGHHLRRQGDALRREDRPGAGGRAGRAALGRVSLRSHGADHLLPRRSARALLRRAGAVQDGQRRPELGRHQPGPDAQGSRRPADARHLRGRRREDASIAASSTRSGRRRKT